MFADADIKLRAPGLRYTTVPVERGQTIRGVLIGPIRRVWCHWCNDASKPCRREISGGKLKCFCEETPQKKRVNGYCPLGLKDGTRVVVILSATTTLSLADRVPGDVLELARPDREKARIRARLVFDHDFPSTMLAEWKKGKPADIGEYLVYVLWGDEVLCSFFDATFKREHTPQMPPLVRRKRRDTDTPPPKSDNALSLGHILNGIGQGSQ